MNGAIVVVKTLAGQGGGKIGIGTVFGDRVFQINQPCGERGDKVVEGRLPRFLFYWILPSGIALAAVLYLELTTPGRRSAAPHQALQKGAAANRIQPLTVNMPLQ